MAEPPYSLDEFWSLAAALGNDLKKCATALETLANNEEVEERERWLWFWRRMCAHTVFALVEGTTYYMMYVVYVTRNSRDVVFTPDEMEILEKAYDFDEEREVEAGLTPPQMLERIKFAFNAFARVHYSDYVLPFKDHDWLQVKEIFMIKEIITHPRSTADLEVFDDNAMDSLEGAAWFMNCTISLLKSSRESMEARAALGEAEKDEPIM